jgi:hypothetical protein
MPAYFQTGTFPIGFSSWHKAEDRLDIERIEDGDNVTDAMRKGRMLEIETVLCPTVVEVPFAGGIMRVESDKKQLALAGVPWTNNGVQLLNREVTWYEPIQNAEYARILDPLVDTYKVVGTMMVGSLGQIVIVQMEMPDFYVGDNLNEGHTVYLTVAEDRKTGKKHYGTSITRVVCQNTYFMAVGGGLRSLPNCKDANLMLEFRTQIEQAMITRREQELARLNALFTTRATKLDETEVAAAMFPTPSRPKIMDIVDEARVRGVDMESDSPAVQAMSRKEQTSKYQYERDMARQEARMKAFFGLIGQFNDEHPYAAHTKYGIMQAATGFWNHYDGFRSDEATAMYNLFFGDRQRAMQNAFAVLEK